MNVWMDMDLFGCGKIIRSTKLRIISPNFDIFPDSHTSMCLATFVWYFSDVFYVLSKRKFVMNCRYFTHMIEIEMEMKSVLN